MFFKHRFKLVVEKSKTICACGIIIVISTFGILNGNISKSLVKTWLKQDLDVVGVPPRFAHHRSHPVLLWNSQRADDELLSEPGC